MSVVQINTDPNRRQLNQFGFIWMGFVAVVGVVACFNIHNTSLSRGLWVAAVVVPVVGWVFPRCMRWVFLGMSYLAFPIGFVASHVVLAVVYYLVLTPIGLLTRVFGYDSMKRRFDPEAKSYWVERSAAAVDPKHYFRQF